MLRVIRDSVISLLFLISALITVFGLIPYVNPSGPDTVIAVSTVSVIAAYCFVAYLWYKTKYSRASKYGEALPMVNEGFRSMHNLRRREPSIAEVVKSCTNLCECVAKAFSIITSSDCSASIKMVTYREDDAGNTRFAVETFARDRISGQKRKRRGVRVDHWIDRNSDFYQIFENIDTSHNDYFFSNQLPSLHSYLNTSFSYYGDPPDDGGLHGYLARFIKWPLPYKSTIVVPLYDKNQNDSLVGFLCVDSPNLGAFRQQYDVHLLAGIAEGIYNYMRDVSNNEEDFSYDPLDGS